MSSPLVETENLGKTYGDVAALDDCNLEVRRGEIFGLLGPNGSGKTTLIRLLMGFLRASRGHATIDRLDCYRDSVAVHRLVSYLPGDVRLFRQMRGREVLQFFCDMRPGGDFSRSLKLADRLELDISRKVAFYSTGMRQKLALAATLAADTPLLILDEPTSNLDPTTRADVLSLVASARDRGRTVVFSSHVLWESEQVCDRIVILRKGKLVHTQTISELRRRHRIMARLGGPWQPPPPEFASQISISHNGDSQILIETPLELSSLLGWLAELPLEEVRIEPVGLKSVYDRYHRTHPEPGQWI